jgi:hypothetical protein
MLDIDQRQRRALKIGMLGLIIGTAGALLTAYLSEPIGQIMFLAGSLLVFSGVLVTWVFAFHAEAGKKEKNKKD